MSTTSAQRQKASSSRPPSGSAVLLPVEENPCPVRAVALGGNHVMHTREIDDYPVTVCGYCGVDWQTLDADLRKRVPAKVTTTPKTHADGSPRQAQ